MKRCPLCGASFPDTDQFCELDGAQLVSDYSYRMAAPVVERDPHQRNAAEQTEFPGYPQARGSQNWKIYASLAVAAVAIGAILFIAYQQLAREPNGPGSDESSNASATQQPPLLTALPASFASVSPSAEPSPSPSATPTPSTPADATAIVLSSSPVSTGRDETLKSGTVVIRLTNGTSVEADEVWETGEGIWYRRRGVITLLERNQVTAINRAPPESSPSATPATSPGTSP